MEPFMPDSPNQQAVDLSITVLGRTLEHLGVQMYKRRDAAIAELVANCWDAGATRVDIRIPEALDYDPAQSKITITDNGVGMTSEQVQSEYLVVGRNRRRTGGSTGGKSRAVMGKKGIGKLAGFGLASEMEVSTWRDDRSTTFTLDVDDLKRDSGMVASVPIKGIRSTKPDWATSDAGTRLLLRDLKHKSALDAEKRLATRSASPEMPRLFGERAAALSIHSLQFLFPFDWLHFAAGRHQICNFSDVTQSAVAP
jgi:Histidine kinase-, DNA gyrase B-, and HSP90-like ATPase